MMQRVFQFSVRMECRKMKSKPFICWSSLASHWGFSSSVVTELLCGNIISMLWRHYFCMPKAQNFLSNKCSPALKILSRSDFLWTLKEKNVAGLASYWLLAISWTDVLGGGQCGRPVTLSEVPAGVLKGGKQSTNNSDSGHTYWVFDLILRKGVSYGIEIYVNVKRHFSSSLNLINEQCCLWFTVLQWLIIRLQIKQKQTKKKDKKAIYLEVFMLLL